MVAPIFIVAAIGFFWVRGGQPFDNETISALVMYVGSPCLIFASLTAHRQNLADLLVVVGAAAASIAITAVLGYLLLRLLGWPVRTYLGTLTHANSGNMGLPVCLLAFGESGLALGMAFFLINSISQYSLGLSLASGEFRPTQLLRQPVIWAVLAVALVLLSDAPIPAWFNSTTELLGGLTIPAMLLMLGTSLANLQISHLLETFSVALARLLLGLGIGITIIMVLGLEGAIAGVVLLQTTMPAAVFNYVFAQRYDNQPDRVAAVILLSTLLSVVTLPLLVGAALAL